MAKTELKWAPVLGQWMLLSGAVFVDRGDSKKAMNSLEKAGTDIRDSSLSIWIFPEGTRTSSESPNMLPFKKGAFRLAVNAGAPVVPVVCENYWRLYRKGVFDSGKLIVKVLPPVSTTNMTASDIPALAVRTREMMLAALREISDPVSAAAADNKLLESVSEEAKTPSIAHPTDTFAGRTEVPGSIVTARSISASAEAERLKDSPTGSVTDDELVMVDRAT